ncbi:hypothetical protein [Magnetofaba australis]|nr:hypothetical protein [Magnetofaba australis]
MRFLKKLIAALMALFGKSPAKSKGKKDGDGKAPEDIYPMW